MSDTKTDMPKVCQMLDNGWQLQVYKNQLGSYTVEAYHSKASVRQRVKDAMYEDARQSWGDEFTHEIGVLASDLSTDDFTPEQALTRMAYKVMGEVI